MERMGESRRKSFVPKATAVRKCRLGKVKGFLGRDPWTWIMECLRGSRGRSGREALSAAQRSWLCVL